MMVPPFVNRLRISAVRKDLFDRWSKEIVLVLLIDVSRVTARRGTIFLEGELPRRSGEEPGLRSEEFEFEEREPLLGLWELRGLRLSHEDEDGDGEAGRVTDSLLRLSGMGLGGIGEGSCQR
jgi:hypothetical protein